jgi:glycosyltransferase involved in cell wall biosynthesis
VGLDRQDLKNIHEAHDAFDKYGVEGKRKIREYLAKNLPGPGCGPGCRIEERIREAMDPECEVCVVIPAYAERDYILAPLEALARQRDVKPAQYEVIVVVNNPPAAARKEHEQVQPGDGEAFANNRRTLELLRHIKEEETGVLLRPGEQKIIAAIKKSGLRLFAIDKSSWGKTLPEAEANVGGARNRGTAEAVERFYKYPGRNGIIAHTDADTCADNYYIRGLIDVFKERPQLVGIGGGIQTSFYDDDKEQKREDVKDLVYARTLIGYEWLLDFLFKRIDNNSGRKTIFVGCNMATRAFEAALAGGIPKIAGAEDTTFSEWMAGLGEIDYVSKVMVSQGVRYSERTATGYGTNMMKCSRQIKETGTVLVRTLECELMKYKLQGALRQAILYQRTSVMELKEILTLNNELILHDEDLRALSRLLGQREERTAAERRKDVLRMWEKIAAVVEDRMETAPIVEAASTLISVFCMIEKVKREFHIIKAEKRQEIDDNLSTLDYFLDHIFDNDLQRSQIDVLEDHIVSLLENSGTSYARRIMEKTHAIREAANLIAAAKTKAGARENIKTHYLAELVSPEDDPILLILLDLKSMVEALSKVKLKKSVIELLFSG